MKVVYTEEALKDLDAIADWLIVHYPAVAPVEAHPECRRTHRALAGKFAPFGDAPRCSRSAARSLSIQDFLSRRGWHGPDTPHPSRRTATLG
jgi:plasmid stabilization system protein ParE